MSTHPPHLPKKSFSHVQYNMLRHVPWLLFFVGLCALTAVAMSMALFAWYIPSYVSYYVPAGVQRTVAVSEVAQVDPLFVKDLESKMVEVHRGSSDAPPTTISDETLVAHAMLLSSDGWIAFIAEDTNRLVDTAFAIDADGGIHGFSEVRVDQISGITYAKLMGDGFRVMSIETGTPNVSIYLREGSTWSAELLEETMPTTRNGFQLHLPAEEYVVDARDGSIAISPNGGVVGFIRDNVLVPAWWVQEGLHDMLSGTPFDHTVLSYTYQPVSGLYVADQDTYRSITGLQISTARQPVSTSTLAVGDVIVRFNGAPVRAATIAAEIQQANDSLVFDVYRDGELISVVLE